ncbi:hypothetical protein D3C74_50240 [compost metagenome]
MFVIVTMAELGEDGYAAKVSEHNTGEEVEARISQLLQLGVKRSQIIVVRGESVPLETL